MIQSSLQGLSQETKLLVEGQASLEDLWSVFSTIGEVSDIELFAGGAKISFKEKLHLGKFQDTGELLLGDKTLLVTKVREPEGLRAGDCPPVSLTPPLSSLQQSPWLSSPSSTWLPPKPPTSAFSDLQQSPWFSPPPPTLFPSPSPTPTLPDLQQSPWFILQPQLPAVFIFDDMEVEAGARGWTRDQAHLLQPLTPCSPGDPSTSNLSHGVSSLSLLPTPSPPPVSSVLTNVSTSSDLIQESKSQSMTGIFHSPYKTFLKFQGVPRYVNFPKKKIKRCKVSDQRPNRQGDFCQVS